MTTLTEGPRAGEFIVSEAPGCRSRDQITIGLGAILLAGTVLGYLATTTTAAKSGGNTGNGTIGSVTVDAAAQAGVWQVRMVGGDFDAAIAAQAAGNTGNGTASMHTTKTGAGVKLGAYKAVFTAAATNGGSFIVEDPDGIIVGEGVVGTLFDGVVKFTIADGATDFAVNDTFIITVTALAPTSGLLTFSVTRPDGTTDGTGTVGTAYNGQVNFTIADGSTNFVIGDGFDITVANSGKYVQLNPAATNGAAVAAGILYAGGGTVAADDRGVGVVRDAEVNSYLLTWPSGISAGNKATAIAQLAARGIIVRT